MYCVVYAIIVWIPIDCVQLEAPSQCRPYSRTESLNRDWSPAAIGRFGLTDSGSQSPLSSPLPNTALSTPLSVVTALSTLGDADAMDPSDLGDIAANADQARLVGNDAHTCLDATETQLWLLEVKLDRISMFLEH